MRGQAPEHYKSRSRRGTNRASALFVVFMVSLIFLSLIIFLALCSASAASKSIGKMDGENIRLACGATRFPETCVASLQKSAKNSTSFGIIQSAIAISSDNLQTAQSMVDEFHAASVGNVNRTSAANNCKELLSNSLYRTSSAAAAAQQRFGMKDARAWMSAALAYQYDCWSSIKYVNETEQTNRTMSFLDSLIILTSNALSMMWSYDVYGINVANWTQPKTERDEFWEGNRSDDRFPFQAMFPSNLIANATVCKDGVGCLKTVMNAVDAAPENLSGHLYVIHIKKGIYKEVVVIPLQKKNIVFLGDGIGKTIITGSIKVGPDGISTYNTATVGVLGDGFMAKDLTFENTAPAPTTQAVAFRSDSDRSFIYNCEFLGNQDTLYAHSLRQFYKSCTIRGNVDFIFGNAAAYFQDCSILVRPRQVDPEKGETNAITAHGRTDPAQLTGFVFFNCSINGTDRYMALRNNNPRVHKNYLGRPWKEYSRTVFIQSSMEVLVSPSGWMIWSGDFALATLYYGEFRSYGPGMKGSSRVSWSSQIPPERLYAYSVPNFLQGDQLVGHLL